MVGKFETFVNTLRSLRKKGTDTYIYSESDIQRERLADMLGDEHYLAREMIERHVARTGIETPMLGVVPKFSRTPGSISDVGPTLGEHTDHYR